MTKGADPKAKAISDCVDRYQRSRGNEFPDLRPFVASVGLLWQRAALIGLAAVDMETRYRAGRPIRCEEYLQTYPELGPLESFPADLIVAEFCLRKEVGAPADIAEFEARFPAQAAQLRGRLDSITLDTDAGVQQQPTNRTEPLAAAFETGISDSPSNEPFPQLADWRAMPKKLGRYEILERLGEGGMGAVYLAYDPGLNRQVALKIPTVRHSQDETAPKRFRLEAALAANLRHPNICTIYDVGAVDGLQYLCMAFVEGVSLSQLIDSKPMQDQRKIAIIAQKAALALQEAHDHQIIHRDVKPANIMIDERGEPILMDFGLARMYGDRDLRLTRAHTIIGTPVYMSPEQAVGAELTPAADVYSLGVVIYHMLAGRVPFTNSSVHELFTSILTDEPEPPSRFADGVDPRLEAICLRAMAKKSEQRFASARELADALGEYLNGSPAQKTNSRTTLHAGLIGGVAVVVVVALAFIFGKSAWVAAPTSTAAGPPIIKDADRPKVPAAIPSGAANPTSAAASSAPVETSSALPPAPTSSPAKAELLRAPFSEGQARAARAAWSRELRQPEEILSAKSEIKLVLIPAGEFLMGSPPTDGDAESIEKPLHRVRILRPFYLGTTEVTKAQFSRFVAATQYQTDAERGTELSEGKEKYGKGTYAFQQSSEDYEFAKSFHWRKLDFKQSDDQPVVAISWNDANAFCEWLSREEGREYRLPTEAEWEFACRAGTTTRFQHSDDPKGMDQVGNIIDESAQREFPDFLTPAYNGDDGFVFTAPVGRFRPNNFGLYDMQGNVWEWCSDHYSGDYYQHAPADDPPGPSSGKLRSVRGSGWSDTAAESRCAIREGEDPAYRVDYIGFRLAMSIPQ